MVAAASLHCVWRCEVECTQTGNEWGPFGQPNYGRAWLCSSAPVGSQIHYPIGNQIRGPLGKEGVCPNFALTVNKFVFSHSGNFRAKASPPKPRSCPKCQFRQ